MNPRPGVLVCACKRDGTIMVDDPLAFAREEHKKWRKLYANDL